MTDNNFVLAGNITLKEGLPNHEYKICGEAGHGGLTTYHKGELFDKRHYITAEYQKAIGETQKRLDAGDIIPLYLNHEKPLAGSHVTKFYWDDKKNAVCYEAVVSEAVAMMIREGKINGVSLYSNPWVKGGGVSFADGFAPFGFVFEELSLTDDRMIPGDPNATVRFLEALEKTFEIDPKHVAKEKQKAFVEQLQRQIPDRLLKNPPQAQEAETEQGNESEATVEEVKKPARELTPLEKFRQRRR